MPAVLSVDSLLQSWSRSAANRPSRSRSSAGCST
uniref:Uncharacterized protein n=1 Tax=Macrostomum lignano TaxID=282301 RepID=A0A1I8HYU3_9PLAT